MKPVPLPGQLRGYRQDKHRAWIYQVPQIALGILSILGLAGALGLSKWGQEYKTLVLICGLLFLGSAYLLMSVSNKKRQIICTRCRNAMQILDVDWTSNQYRQLGGWICGSFFSGADGRIYKQSHGISGRGGKGRMSAIYLIKQRWYACPSCKRCFLGETLLPVTVFKGGGGLYQAIEELKKNPAAGREMEQHHTEED